MRCVRVYYTTVEYSQGLWPGPCTNRFSKRTKIYCQTEPRARSRDKTWMVLFVNCSKVSVNSIKWMDASWGQSQFCEAKIDEMYDWIGCLSLLEASSWFTDWRGLQWPSLASMEEPEAGLQTGLRGYDWTKEFDKKNLLFVLQKVKLSYIRHKDILRPSPSFSVKLRPPPLDSEMGWTGELWLNRVFLILES